MSTVRRVLKNFLSLTFAQVICNLLGFVGVAYLARILGVEGFGSIGFAFAIVSYFLLLTNQGLDIFGTREIARDKEKTKEYTKNINAIKLITSFISFLLLVIFTLVIPKPIEMKKLILFYGFTLFSSALTIEWVFMGSEKMEVIAFSRVLKQAFYLLFIILLVKSAKHISLVPWAFFVSNIIGAGILLYYLLKNLGFWGFEINWKLWKEILKQSLPMGLSSIMIQIYLSSAIVILGFMKGEKAVGWYNAAYKIVLLIGAIGLLYYSSIFPLVSRYYKSSIEKLKTILTYTIKLTVIVALPLGIGSIFAAKPIMKIIYGTEFDPGIIAFQILIWSMIIGWFSCIYGNSLMACDRQKKYMIGVTLGAISNILLNLALIPHFGLVGASITAIASELVVFASMYSQFSKIVEIKFYGFLLKPLIASILMGTFLYLTKNSLNFFLWILTAVIAYLALLFAFRSITIKEVKSLKKEIFSER
ncbi:MAG: flippase [candidate division Zixibacteria bacterium]|nr:flippase [candidate division Zixibacteria bacterium]